MFNNIHALTQMLIEKHLVENSVVVDATVGNGNDALKMISQLGPDGCLYGFDIQKEALEVAEQLLRSRGYHNYKLILQGHENMQEHLKAETVDMIMFNLGYLPKGDKSLTTKLDTTLEGIKSSLTLLKYGGLLLVACYPGHENGMTEYQGLQAYFEGLNQKQFNVFHSHFINQKNHPPTLFVIEKTNKI